MTGQPLLLGFYASWANQLLPALSLANSFKTFSLCVQLRVKWDFCSLYHIQSSSSWISYWDYVKYATNNVLRTIIKTIKQKKQMLIIVEVK